MRRVHGRIAGQQEVEALLLDHPPERQDVRHVPDPRQIGRRAPDDRGPRRADTPLWMTVPRAAGSPNRATASSSVKAEHAVTAAAERSAGTQRRPQHLGDVEDVARRPSASPPGG